MVCSRTLYFLHAISNIFNLLGYNWKAKIEIDHRGLYKHTFKRSFSLIQNINIRPVKDKSLFCFTKCFK